MQLVAILIAGIVIVALGVLMIIFESRVTYFLLTWQKEDRWVVQVNHTRLSTILTACGFIAMGIFFIVISAIYLPSNV